jgi:hypothetical protein
MKYFQTGKNKLTVYFMREAEGVQNGRKNNVK